jgi:hypothetical protein
MRILKWAVLVSNKNSQSPANKALSESVKNKRVHNLVHNIEVHSDLRQVVEVWPKLPVALREAIVKMVV